MTKIFQKRYGLPMVFTSLLVASFMQSGVTAKESTFPFEPCNEDWCSCFVRCKENVTNCPEWFNFSETLETFIYCDTSVTRCTGRSYTKPFNKTAYHFYTGCEEGRYSSVRVERETPPDSYTFKNEILLCGVKPFTTSLKKYKTNSPTMSPSMSMSPSISMSPASQLSNVWIFLVSFIIAALAW